MHVVPWLGLVIILPLFTAATYCETPTGAAVVALLLSQVFQITLERTADGEP